MPDTQNAPEASVAHHVLGVLGGTGDQGKGLARRFALAGLSVLIGSRQAARAVAAGWSGGSSVTSITTPCQLSLCQWHRPTPAVRPQARRPRPALASPTRK